MAKGDVIPDGEILYKYIRPEALPEGQEEIPIGIFQITELSCDWEKYRKDPYTSFHIKEGKTSVIEIHVHDEIRNPRNPNRDGKIEEAWKQEIIHDPIMAEQDPRHGANEAHVLVKGKKKAAVTLALSKHSNRYLR